MKLKKLELSEYGNKAKKIAYNSVLIFGVSCIPGIIESCHNRFIGGIHKNARLIQEEKIERKQKEVNKMRKQLKDILNK